MLRGTLGGLTAGTVLFLAALGALSVALDSEAAPSAASDDSRPSLEVARPAIPAADEGSGLAVDADGLSQ